MIRIKGDRTLVCIRDQHRWCECNCMHAFEISIDGVNAIVCIYDQQNWCECDCVRHAFDFEISIEGDNAIEYMQAVEISEYIEKAFVFTMTCL